MARDRGRARVPLLASKWRFVVLAGLIAFVVLDVVLVAVATQSVRPAPAETPGPIPTFGTSPSDAPSSPSESSPSEATPTVSATPAAAGAEPLLLSAVSASEAWRASPGVCPAGTNPAAARATVEHTVDGGATWTPVDLGAQAFDSIVTIDATPQKVTIVGERAPACAVQAIASATAGRSWAASPADVSAAVFVAPDSSLHIAAASSTAPCPDAAKAVVGATETAVVCGDGMRVKPNSGSWVTVAMPGLVGVTTAPGSFTVARTGVAGCTGIALQSVATPVTPASTSTPLGCATISGSGGPLSADKVAVSRIGPDIWLWASGKSRLSTNGGATW